MCFKLKPNTNFPRLAILVREFSKPLSSSLSISFLIMDLLALSENFPLAISLSPTSAADCVLAKQFSKSALLLPTIPHPSLLY